MVLIKNITMTKKEKVLACYRFVNMRSTAKLCDVTPAYVSVLWSEEGFPYKEELRNNLKYPY
jgi:hypothetical protein